MALTEEEKREIMKEVKESGLKGEAALDYAWKLAMNKAEKKKGYVKGHIRKTKRGATAVKPHLRKTNRRAIKWGFDLTDFDSAETFQNILDKFGLKNYKRITHSFKGTDGSTVRYYSFVWSKPGLKIITGNNPITGEYSSPGGREKDFGYASYIGIEGDEDEVIAIKNEIRKRGTFIKGESEYDREFI